MSLLRQLTVRTVRGPMFGVVGTEWTLAYPLVSQGLEGWGAKTSPLTDPAKADAIARALLEDRCVLVDRPVALLAHLQARVLCNLSCAKRGQHRGLVSTLTA